MLSRRPRLVVSLTDRFTRRFPAGRVRVLSGEPSVKIVRNPGGHFLFYNILRDVVHIRVDSAYYFILEEDVHLSELGQGHPFHAIFLEPKPCYPFPSRTTLIRGKVTDSRGNLIPGADVGIEGTSVRTATDTRGEFACWVETLREEDIVLKKGKRFLKGGRDRFLALQVTYHRMTGRVEMIDVPEGMVTVLKSPVILK